LRQITDKARELGANSLFNQILPLLMSPSLEDQERHLLVKVIDRILYKLDELVRPYVHKILVVIEPLLIDEDYYARVEGREIISNLAKVSVALFHFRQPTQYCYFTVKSKMLSGRLFISEYCSMHSFTLILA